MPHEGTILRLPVPKPSLRHRNRHREEFPMERLMTPQQRPASNKSTYHPFLFTLMTCSALAELGLTAFLVSAGNEHGTWPSKRYHVL